MTRILEHPVADAAAGPYSVAVTDDGAIWFALVHAAQVGRRDADGSVAFVGLGDGARPSLVVRATDESVWVTDTTGDRIVHVGRGSDDSLRVINEVAMPTTGSAPFGIAVAYDGTVWVTETATDALARVDILGRVTEFPTGRPHGFPSMIATSGESVWFTLNAGNAVGHVRGGDAAIRYFELPQAASAPVGIAVAEDGAAWVAEIGAGALARIGRDDTLTEFVLPDPTARPHAIAADPAGGCWFTLWAANQLGHVTDAGAFELYDLPAGQSEPHGVAVAPDGHVWVALESGALAELIP